MKMIAFIPRDISSLRAPNISDMMKNGSTVGLESRFGQSDEQEFSDLFNEHSSQSMESTVQNTEKVSLKTPHLLADEVSKSISEPSYIALEEQAFGEKGLLSLNAEKYPDFKFGLSLQSLKAELNFQDINFEELPKESVSFAALEDIDIEQVEVLQKLEEKAHQVGVALPLEVKNAVSANMIGKSKAETTSNQQALFERSRAPLTMQVDQATLSTSSETVDVRPGLEKVGDIKPAANGQFERPLPVAQGSLRTVDPLLTLKQAHKPEVTAAIPTAVMKPATPIVSATLGDATMQIPVLPSIVPHEISSVIVRSVAAPVSQSIRAGDASSLDVASDRSTKSMELQLVPRSLGVVEVKIVRSNGQLNIMMRTQTVEAENLLRIETGSIQEVIRAAGIAMDDIKISIQNQPDLDANQARQAKTDDQSFMQFEQNGESQTSSEHQEKIGDLADIDLSSNSSSAANEKSRDPDSRDGLYF